MVYNYRELEPQLFYSKEDVEDRIRIAGWYGALFGFGIGVLSTCTIFYLLHG